MSTRCECCDLLIESCGKAKAEAQRKQELAHRSWLIGQRWFESTYQGYCVRCTQGFRPGTLIKPVGDRAYMAYCCAPDLPEQLTVTLR